MAKPGEIGIKRIISASGYSLKGLVSCWQMEAAFRQEVAGAVVLIPLALYLGDGGVEKAVLIACCMLVLVVELLNSGIEAVVDRIGHEYHELSGLAKDIGSAAVMLSILTLVGCWVLVLLF
ncbi:MAG: diacylglycerol kinase [Pseudomonadota bacterium]